MIGVFIDGIRIGSIMHFKHQRYWVAYAPRDIKEQFKTRKDAVAWLTLVHQHRTSSVNSQHQERGK